MQVFRERMAERGGKPLPLSYYMQPSVTAVEGAPPVDIFTVKLGGQTFHEALQSNNGFPIINTFLLAGVDVNIRDKSGATPLHTAVTRVASTAEDDEDADYLFFSECPNNVIIAFLLDNGAELNSQNMAGETPLMVAAATQNIGALRVLLLRGADTSVRDEMGHTVLHHAARYPIVLQTLQAWIPELPAHAVRECLLHTVCQQGQGAEFAALFLIEQLGVDVNAIESEVAADAIVDEAEVNRLEVATHGRDATSTAAVTVCEGRTPLHYAVLAGDLDVVRTMLMKGADVFKSDTAGVTPIQLAAECAFLSSPSPSSSLSVLSYLRRLFGVFVRYKWNSVGTRGGKSKRIYSMLQAYRSEASPKMREAMLQRDAVGGTSLWELNTFNDVAMFVAAATLPHAFVALCAKVTVCFWVVAVVAFFCLVSCTSFNQKDSRRLNSRPLRSAGFFLGYTVALTTCCFSQIEAMWTTHSVARYCFFLCATGSAVCALLVVLRSPGIVDSTAGQRLGIYKTIFHTNGALPEDVRHTIDLHCMVKKPMRAQRCRHLGRIVLRYDHYCTWLASSIGGGNHRAYVAFLNFYAGFLVVCYYCTHLLSLNKTHSDMRNGDQDDPTLRHFVDVYVLLVLPVVLIFFFYTLLKQLWYIGRCVTSYDVAYPSRCPWCFMLGARTYSIFDAGFLVNTYHFFFLMDDLTAISYRMPVLSSRLQQIVKKYQDVQFSNGYGGDFHSHTHGNHDCSQHKRLGQQQCSNLPFSDKLIHTGDGFNPLASSPVIIAPTTSASSSIVVGGGSSSSGDAAASLSEPEAVVGRLFQLMAQHDTTEVEAASELQATVPPEEWPEMVAKAQSMFRFFKNTVTAGN